MLILTVPFLLGILLVAEQSSELTGEKAVRYKLKKSKSNKWDISFENAPVGILALPGAPMKKERELQKGSWLVISFGVFSVPDRRSLDAALKLYPKYQDSIKLGVRPFWDYDEITRWFPQYRDFSESPIWIVYVNGRVVAWRTGPMDAKGIDAFLRETFKGKGK